MRAHSLGCLNSCLKLLITSLRSAISMNEYCVNAAVVSQAENGFNPRSIGRPTQLSTETIGVTKQFTHPDICEAS